MGDLNPHGSRVPEGAYAAAIQAIKGAIDESGTRKTLYGDDELTGLYVGPPDDPDEYELITKGLLGGEGVIFRARYSGQLTTPVDQYAIKMLTIVGDAPTPADIARWRDQIPVLRGLDHPHLVRVHDVFLAGPPHRKGQGAHLPRRFPYILMDWVPGRSLQEIVRQGQVSVSDLLTHISELASAVTALHSFTRTLGNPMLHRDIKPDNAVVSPQRGLVLVDVGGLRRLDDGFDIRGMHSPAYTAPEVMKNLREPRTKASDLYSVGAVAYFAVTGMLPGDSEQPTQYQQMLDNCSVVAHRNGAANPPAFAATLMAMLQADPLKRPADAVSWATDLTRHFRRAPHPTELAAAPLTRTASVHTGDVRKWRLVGVAASLAAVAAIGGTMIWNRSDTGHSPLPTGAAASPPVAGTVTATVTKTVTANPAAPSSPSDGTSATPASAATGEAGFIRIGSPKRIAFNAFNCGNGSVFNFASMTVFPTDKAPSDFTPDVTYQNCSGAQIQFTKIGGSAPKQVAASAKQCAETLQTAAVNEVAPEKSGIVCVETGDGSIGILQITDLPAGLNSIDKPKVVATASLWRRK